jgi:hypothetical protein
MSLEAGSAGGWAGAIVAALGFFFALLQLRSSTKVQRSQFLLDATQRYFGDVEVRQLYYDIDHEKFSLVFENGEPSKVIRGDDSPVCFKRSEAAWEDLKEGTERAWSELAKATEGFVSRFK